jgi:hypothetical protein
MHTTGANPYMSKSVHLGPSLDFPTITLAKKHFDPFRTEGGLNQDVPPDQFNQLRLLYERYCTNTDFPMPSAVTAFFPTMEKRGAGYTRCLGVRFADGTSTTFSLDKALSAVASVR